MKKSIIRKAIWVLVGIAMLSMGGCRSHRHLQRGDTAGDSTAIQPGEPTTPPASQSARLDTVKDVHYTTFSANFSCTVENMNVNGQIRILHDSIIWISCTKIFEVARVLITPTRIQAYSKLLNKHFDGDYATLCRRWGLDMDFATLQALLTGNCLPHCTLTEEPQLKNGTVTLTCSQATANSSQKRQIVMLKNHSDWKLQATRLHSPAFAQRLTCTYGAPRELNRQKCSSSIEIQLNSKRFNVSTTLEYDKITIDPVQTYPFNIPARSQAL